MDPTKVSRAGMRTVDAESLHAQTTADGLVITKLQQEDSGPPSKGCNIPEVKTEFEAALQTALKAINARNNLKIELSIAAP